PPSMPPGVLPAHVGQRPLPSDEAFHFGLHTQTSAILTSTAGIGAQLAAPDKNRPTQFHFLDGSVTDVALANGHTGGFAVGCRPASPSSSLDALRDESLSGARIVSKEDIGSTDNTHVR